jgi:hypothetical protein
LWYTHKIPVDGFIGESSEAADKRKRKRVDGPGSIEAGFARSESVSAELRSRQKKKLLLNIINQQDFYDRIVKLVIMRNLPYQIVKWPKLKDLLFCINPIIEKKG